MIPENITKDNVLKALDEIDRFGVPKERDSTKYLLRNNGRNYPPKYVISIANKYANGNELEPFEFGGGKETNNFLTKLGFNIYSEEGNKIVVEIKSKAKKDNNIKIEKITQKKK